MKQSIFENIPDELREEYIESLIENEKFKLERIVSDNHSTKENFWYDQPQNEFVLLIKGRACLRFEEGEKEILNPGDYLIIPAHKKHRVEETSSDEKTYWLALHY